MRRRRTEATAACRKVGTSAGWRRACGCSAANVGGVARATAFACWVFTTVALPGRTEEETRRPDQADGRGALGWE